MTPEQAQHRAALLLVHRLIHRRGLTLIEALTAVDQRRRGEPGPHTDLVTAEANAYVREFSVSLRALVEAFRPLMAAAAKAMTGLAKALQPVARQLAEHAAASSAPARRRDRPAWATSYGPPPGRRSAR